jgi:2-polyprenyl-3-methyl-5-hydroxy-6-metoxy-1,4-benzoquinol methylase
MRMRFLRRVRVWLANRAEVSSAAEKQFQRDQPKRGRRFATGGGSLPPDFELDGRRILDIAVGPEARIAIPMARGGASVVGHDLSPESLERAAQRLQESGVPERVELVEGDASVLAFPDASFDGVVIFNVLSHFPTKQAALEQLKESARVLRPGGQLFLRDFGNSLCPLSWQYIFHASVLRRLLRRRGTLHYVTPAELGRALHDAGLEVVWRDMRLPPRFLLFDRLPARWHRRAYRPWFPVFRALERLLRRFGLLSTLGYEYNVLCRRLDGAAG